MIINESCVSLMEGIIQGNNSFPIDTTDQMINAVRFFKYCKNGDRMRLGIEVASKLAENKVQLQLDDDHPFKPYAKHIEDPDRIVPIAYNKFPNILMRTEIYSILRKLYVCTSQSNYDNIFNLMIDVENSLTNYIRDLIASDDTTQINLDDMKKINTYLNTEWEDIIDFLRYSFRIDMTLDILNSLSTYNEDMTLDENLNNLNKFIYYDSGYGCIVFRNFYEVLLNDDYDQSSDDVIEKIKTTIMINLDTACKLKSNPGMDSDVRDEIIDHLTSTPNGRNYIQEYFGISKDHTMLNIGIVDRVVETIRDNEIAMKLSNFDIRDFYKRFVKEIKSPNEIEILSILDSHRFDTVRSYLDKNYAIVYIGSRKGENYVIYRSTGDKVYTYFATKFDNILCGELEGAATIVLFRKPIPVYDMEKTMESITVDPDGRVKIAITKKESYMDLYMQNHKILRVNEKSDNINGIKKGVATCFALINSIENDRNYKSDKDKVKARAFLTNDFKTYMKLILEREPNFDFAKYYHSLDFDKIVIEITPQTIQGIKKLVAALLL